MDMTQVYMSEFIGTAVLIAFGSSVNSSILLKKTIVSAFGTNWLHITIGWALAVTFGVFVGFALGGPAHLNPAVTLAICILGGMDWNVLLPMSLVQTAGAFVGAMFTMVLYYPHFKETMPDEGNVVGIFATGPAIPNKLFNFLSEVIATFMFMLAILCLGKMVDGLPPVVIGALVCSIGMSFGATTGYAINPARDLGPRLAYAILPVPNKGPSNFGYVWVPIIGPMVGAGLATLLFLAVAP